MEITTLRVFSLYIDLPRWVAFSYWNYVIVCPPSLSISDNEFFVIKTEKFSIGHFSPKTCINFWKFHEENVGRIFASSKIRIVRNC